MRDVGSDSNEREVAHRELRQIGATLPGPSDLGREMDLFSPLGLCIFMVGQTFAIISAQGC